MISERISNKFFSAQYSTFSCWRSQAFTNLKSVTDWKIKSWIDDVHRSHDGRNSAACADHTVHLPIRRQIQNQFSPTIQTNNYKKVLILQFPVINTNLPVFLS